MSRRIDSIIDQNSGHLGSPRAKDVADVLPRGSLTNVRAPSTPKRDDKSRSPLHDAMLRRKGKHGR